jgi:hypothetical protein
MGSGEALTRVNTTQLKQSRKQFVTIKGTICNNCLITYII